MWNAPGVVRLGHVVQLACLLAAGVCAACGPSPSPPTGDLVVWQKLGSWSGQGLLQTNPFENDSGMLRVDWRAHSDGALGDGILRVFLHSAVSGRRLAVAVDHRGAGSGTVYINEDPRGFYFVIESAGLDWTVDVAEGIPGRQVARKNRPVTRRSSRVTGSLQLRGCTSGVQFCHDRGGVDVLMESDNFVASDCEGVCPFDVEELTRRLYSSCLVA